MSTQSRHFSDNSCGSLLYSYNAPD